MIYFDKDGTLSYFYSNPSSKFNSPDRVVLHDQPVLGRDRDAVLGDKATRDGQDEGGARAPQLFVDVEQLHQLGDAKLLPRDHPAHRSPPPQTGKTLSSVIAAVATREGDTDSI